MPKPTIPQSLQPPVRTLTLGQQKAPGIKAAQVAQIRTDYEKFVEKIPTLSFAEYKAKYANLPAELKQYFESPAKLQADLDTANAPALEAQRDYAIGYKIGTGAGAKEGLGNAPQRNASAALKKGFQDARKKRRYAVESYNLQVQEFKDYVKDSTAKGFKPIIKSGFKDVVDPTTGNVVWKNKAYTEVVGFEDTIGKQTILPADLTLARPEDLSSPQEQLQTLATAADFPKTTGQKIKLFAKDYYQKGIKEPVIAVAGVPQRTANFFYDEYALDKTNLKVSQKVGIYGSAVIDTTFRILNPKTKPGQRFEPMTYASRDKKAEELSTFSMGVLSAPRDKQKELAIAGGIGAAFVFGGGLIAGLGTGGAFFAETGGSLFALSYGIERYTTYDKTPAGKAKGEVLTDTAIDLIGFTGGGKAAQSLGFDKFGGMIGRGIANVRRGKLELDPKAKADAEKLLRDERLALDKLGKEADKLSIGGEPFVRKRQGDITGAKGREINLFSQDQGNFKRILQARRDTEINLLSGFEEAPLIFTSRGGKAPEFGSNIISKNVEIGLDKTLFPQVKDIPIKTIRGKDRNVFAGFNRAGEFSATTYGTYRGSRRGDEFLGVGTLWARGSRDRPINIRDIIIKQKGDAPAEISYYAKGKKSRIVRDNLIVGKIPEKRLTDTYLVDNKIIETREDAAANTITSIYSSNVKRIDAKPQSLSLGEYTKEMGRKPRTKEELDYAFTFAKDKGVQLGAEVKTITGTRETSEGTIFEYTKKGYSIGKEGSIKLKTKSTPEGRTKPASRVIRDIEEPSGGGLIQIQQQAQPPRKLTFPTPAKFVKDTPLYVGGKGGSSSGGAYAFQGGKSVFGSPRSGGGLGFSNVPNTSLGLGAGLGSGIGLVGGLGIKSLVDTSTGLKSPLDTQVKNKTKLDTENVLITNFDTAQVPLINFTQSLQQQTQQQQQQSQQTSQRSAQTFAPALILRTPTSTPTKTPEKTIDRTFEFFSPFLPPKTGEFKKKNIEGYNILVREKGKYKKVNTKPYTRRGAMDLGARTVDNTVNATWKITKVTKSVTKKGKKKTSPKLFRPKSLQKGDGYFKETKVKYRPYQVKKGKKVALVNKWIEKQGKRADTSGEQRGLTIAKFKAQSTKKRRNKFRI